MFLNPHILLIECDDYRIWRLFCFLTVTGVPTDIIDFQILRMFLSLFVRIFCSVYYINNIQSYTRILNHICNYQDVAKFDTEPYAVRNAFMWSNWQIYYIFPCVYCNRSQMTSQPAKNKNVRHETKSSGVTVVLYTLWRVLRSITVHTHGKM